ncbi:response regulator [Heyndrickxia sp. NPDC080065]|uniref:response regulator n=1 Tax=Heyndrickxia sp. NPDC080065 TaxID=3390568 RepID=UPI003CFFB5BA
MINVIISEDDFRVASIHEQFLNKIEDVCVVGKALNGEQTLILLKNNQVDLVILDIFMPDQLGTDLLYEIRKDYPHVDVIIISAASEKMYVEASIRQGAIDYIIKPATMERFRQSIESYKRKHQLFSDSEELNQDIIDTYFGLTAERTNLNKNLPKGIDPLTLQKVKVILKALPNGVSAEELGEKMGASRPTARRYLEYLISIGEGNAELEYGIVGRPERKYRLSK